MNLQETIKKVDSLKAELDKLLPMKEEAEEKLWKKFRLDWNYNSNHIEGNTLTYGETELLLLFDKMPDTPGRKDFREYEEMKGHDVALKMVVELAKDKERPLTESFIRKLNEIILVRPFWKEAETPSGNKTEKEIQVGQYKTSPNSVRTASGDIFRYASPEETPAQMNDLMNFYNVHFKSTDSHKVWLAAMVHYQFVIIHPFDDGNGRISRLLMNYILLKAGYPPAVVQSKDKKGYLTALNKADTGDLESFVVYIAEQVIRSLELNIKAAKGESIEEADDIDKEIALLKITQSKDKKVLEKTPELVWEVYELSIKPFLLKLDEQLSSFNDLFSGRVVDYSIQTSMGGISGTLDHITSIIEASQKLVSEKANAIKESNPPPKDINSLQVQYYWKGYKNAGTNVFPASSNINIFFEQFRYRMESHNAPTKPVLLYKEFLTEEQINSFVHEIRKVVLEQIKDNLKR